MLLRIEVEAEAEDPQGAKESLAMALERYAPARVVEVAPVYRQERMEYSRMDPPTAGAMVDGSRRLVPSVDCGVSSSFARPSGVPEGAGETGSDILAGLPTEGVVGPFARADNALMAAMEANEEIRG